MNVISEVVLVVRNARDKIQTAKFVLEQEGNTYFIKRFTGQFGGKITQQPTKTIERGKAARTVLMQAQLEFASLIKEKTDKGYKKLSDLTKTPFSQITESELDSLVPTIKTDSRGNIKHQLAKSEKDCTPNVWDKPMFCSRKINGVRCFLMWNKDREEVISVSRGGSEYDVATQHIRNSKILKNYLKENPEVILDGELYKHGWSLQKISGTARTKTLTPDCEKLEFWIFDIADINTDFNSRLDQLTDLEILFEEEEKIVFVEHILLEGWYNIKKYHDKFVAEGFEGLVARKPFKKYEPGKRNSDWIKVKDYQEDTFAIIGFKDGLRPEDFCFVLETKSGIPFEAKPVGTREEKEEYMADIENIVGQYGEVKFFELSDRGVPLQPVFIAVRYDLK